MAVGETVARTEFETRPDPDTGVPVTLLTDHCGDTSIPYFRRRIFSDDGKWLLLSSNRTGLWQLYALGVDTGDLVQLSDDPEGMTEGFGIYWAAPTILPTRGAACYFTGNELRRVNLDGSDNRVLLELPQDFPGRHGGMDVTSDGATLVFTIQERMPYRPMMLQHPRCLVMRVNTDTGDFEVVWGENEHISHTLVSPIDPDIMVFAHEGPWHLVQRTWGLRVSTREVWPLIPQRKHCERAGHEFFTRRGRLVTEYAWRFHPNATDWINLDIFVWPDGRDPQAFRYLWDSPGPVGHNQVSWHDEILGVGDACYPEENFPHGRDYIGLIRYKDEIAWPIPLCRHDCTRKRFLGHAFMQFSLDDRWVYFNSERGGKVNVYRAPVTL